MDLLEIVRHIHHASFLIEHNGRKIYIDPFEIIDKKHDADFIFCTHTHYDHLSLGDIKELINENTILVVTDDAENKVRNLPVKEVVLALPNKEFEIAGLKFKTVNSYNTNKKFHPKQNKWVGYIIEINGFKYYFAGDTDFIPEMENIETDVAFLPVGGTYTMTAKEAAEAANTIKPKIAVPMHFAYLVGEKNDAETFLSFLDKDIEGRILGVDN